ncbi:hypothetical protein B0H14DRAFT_3430678 [Mycena olivaceomarginata]|nr:hypothetical protein B0H14DRAFT_3430678 [Mycena olivaceomarginata]
MAAKTTLPDPPGINPVEQPLKKKGTATAFPTSEQAERHAAIRAQHILDLEGAAAMGDTGPSHTQPQRVGRKYNKLVDDLIIEEEILNKDPNTKLKTTIIVYCIACNQDTKFHNPNHIKEHVLSCKNLAELFPSLLTKVIKECGEHGKGTGKLLPNNEAGLHIEVDHPEVNTAGSASTSGPGIAEYYTPVKMTPARQAALDLALFQLVICAALPFSFVGNPWLINFLLIAVPNYITPERTAFFIHHITEQLAAFLAALKIFLQSRFHLTLLFDGWSSRAKDKIYTFHTTLPS